MRKGGGKWNCLITGVVWKIMLFWWYIKKKFKYINNYIIFPFVCNKQINYIIVVIIFDPVRRYRLERKRKKNTSFSKKTLFLWDHNLASIKKAFWVRGQSFQISVFFEYALYVKFQVSAILPDDLCRKSCKKKKSTVQVPIF